MTDSRLEIRPAKSDLDWAEAKTIILQYVEWLNFDLSFQNFDDEMVRLPEMYNERDGGMYLALLGNDAVGVAGLRRFSSADAELKRMFVRPEARGLGVGIFLLRHCIECARSLQYETIKLDTAAFMSDAVKLYTSHGFVEIPAYRFNPHDHARYFELRLR